MELETCAGCGAQLEYDERAKLPLSPTKHVWVCRGRTRSAVEVMPHEYAGKKSCVQAALEKASLCPGCGREETFPGILCDDCHDKIAMAERVAAQSKAEGYVLDKYMGPSLPFCDELEPLTIAIATLAAAPGTVVERYTRIHDRRFVLPFLPAGAKEPGYSGDGWGGVHVYIRPEQAKAIDIIMRSLAKLLTDQRAKGREEGRSILAGLANGDLTVEQLNTQPKWTDKDLHK